MQDIALDACCLINLCAAGEILRPSLSPTVGQRHDAKAHRIAGRSSGFGLNLHVPAKVMREALYIMQPNEEEPTKLEERPLDLQPYLAAGLLLPCDFETHEEIDLFVQMATRLGDGEAACFALAMKRGWALATDDRLARRFASESSLRVVTTPELVKLWAENTHASAKQIGATLQNIQQFASFTPRRNSPEYSWWANVFLG